MKEDDITAVKVKGKIINKEEVEKNIFRDIEMGMTIRDACMLNGVGERYLYDRMDWHPELNIRMRLDAALEKRDAQRTKNVEDSLYKRATGYSVEEVKTEIMPDSQGNPKMIKQLRTKKEFAPDTVAAIFYLTNKAGEKWKNSNYQNISARVEQKECHIIVDNEQQRLALERAAKIINGEDNGADTRLLGEPDSVQ